MQPLIQWKIIALYFFLPFPPKFSKKNICKTLHRRSLVRKRDKNQRSGNFLTLLGITVVLYTSIGLTWISICHRGAVG